MESIASGQNTVAALLAIGDWAAFRRRACSSLSPLFDSAALPNILAKLLTTPSPEGGCQDLRMGLEQLLRWALPNLVCVCVFVVVCVWVTGTGRALTRLTVVVQGAIECNTFAGALVRGGTHSARPFALRRLYLHAVKCSPPNTTKRESFVTATSNRYKRARAASTREVFVDYSFCLLYTSPSPRDGLLSRMPSSA